jgi:Predicted ATPase
MKVVVTKEYKSFLRSTKIEDLPDFVILTGENGAGKSQFLEAIFNKSIILCENDYNIIDDNTQNKQIVKQDSVSIQRAKYSSENIEGIINQVNNDYVNNTNNMVNIEDEHKYSSDIINNIKRDLKKETIDIDIIREWFSLYAYKQLPFESNHLMRIFSFYYQILAKNLVDRHQGDSHLCDDDFIMKYGDAPWNILNEILYERAKLKFKFLSPVSPGANNPINILCKNDLGKRFSVTDLSSGEKVLLTIALSLFSAERNQLKIPKLILLDEVDCSLHPSMIQNLLYLIENVFVEEHKIKVIMTTHSPTTVAIAKDETLFYMQSDNEYRITKDSKDSILKRLAYGIPTLSVTYANRKNIITESSYDAENFEKIYNVLQSNNYLNKNISLNFISSGLNTSKNSGDCNNVVNIVSGFSDNSGVYGIIDWDNKNFPKQNVKVLAYNERYSIENCILDPIAIALLLLYDIKIKINPRDFGLSEGFILVSSIGEFKERLQIVSNAITTALSSKITIDVNKTTQIKYIGGVEINIHTDYLTYQGHELENAIKGVYPQLKAYHNSNDLKKALIKIWSMYPEYIPRCFLEIFQNIMS